MAVVVWAGTSEGRKTTQRVNTARWGLQEPVPGEEREETHQRVEMTRWWPLGRASRLGVGGDGPTSRIDSLGLP